MSKAIFVTGASTGLGRAIVQAALEKGHKVVATARKPKTLQALVDEYGDAIITPKLDVTDHSDIKQAFADAYDRFGRIDVLINNAGYGVIGAIEEFSESEARAQFEVNVFGSLWVTQEALSYMRPQNSGHIINMSSIVGFFAMPGMSMYAASKHALEGLSDGLAKEVEGLNIKVTVINPGPFRTEFNGSNLQQTKKRIESYTTVHDSQESVSEADGQQPGDPNKAAEAVLQVIGMTQPPRHLPLGKIAYETIPGHLEGVLKEIQDFEAVGLPTDYQMAGSVH